MPRRLTGWVSSRPDSSSSSGTAARWASPARTSSRRCPTAASVPRSTRSEQQQPLERRQHDKEQSLFRRRHRDAFGARQGRPGELPGRYAEERRRRSGRHQQDVSVRQHHQRSVHTRSGFHHRRSARQACGDCVGRPVRRRHLWLAPPAIAEGIHGSMSPYRRRASVA